MSFSFAAVPRLVECCTGQTLHGTATDTLELLPLLERLVTEAKGRGLTAGLEDFDAAGHEFWGVPSTSQRVLAIAGLIELALTAGYVDFTEDESRVMTTILEGPFRAFQDNVVSPANEAAIAASAASLHLFSRFMDRLANGNLTATDRKGTLADVFESYANLTSYVWSDSVFHQFLLDTHGTSAEWIRDDDLALLVTPRHFASAVATGFIGEKPAPGAEGGLAAMTYLDWLSAIVASAGDDPLGDDIVRHARWAHSVDRIATRIEQWAEAMSEWPRPVATQPRALFVTVCESVPKTSAPGKA